MTPNRHFLVLSLALRRRLIPEALFHAISEVAAGGQDPVDLLWTRGRLDEATLKDLLAEAARAGSGQVTARPSSADPQPQRQPLPSPSPLAVPRYELGAEIGAGGLGQVVEATDTSIGRQVALKLLVRDADEDLLRRFRWEGRITGRLEHPNIVPVHELGALPGNGQAYICMKRIVGRNMKEVIRSGAWKPRRLVEALRDVCRAVAYAHSRGVIHRDLKPANVMLGDFGEVLVVDWGIARLAGEEELARMAPVSPARPSGDPEARGGTQAGMVFGTPSYMSPEQAMGQADQVDERSDVYSLGATLYEILAGVPPYDAESDLEIMEKVVLADLKPPSEVRSCPPDLESICLQAMARRREDRYGSVAELGGDIESYLEGTKEAERRERLAHEQLARAREQLDLSAHLQAESAGVLAAA
ncbi:MAG: serine/threonine protein kinase, partial [Candidatus Brocadiae bacterium]|nr:serine/threonine protein kinase [Candidatus Brocadiia bacterium]